MLQAGRSRPPATSLPEQPIIPPAIEQRDTELGDQSPSGLGSQSTERLLHLVTSGSVASTSDGMVPNEASSPPGEQSTSSLDDRLASVLEAQTTSRQVDEQASQLVDSETERLDQVPPSTQQPAADPSTAELDDSSTTELVPRSDTGLLNLATGAPVAESMESDAAPSSDEQVIRDLVSSSLIDMSTSALEAKSASALGAGIEDAGKYSPGEQANAGQLVDSSPSEPVVQFTSPPEDLETSSLADSATEQLDDQHSSELVEQLKEDSFAGSPSTIGATEPLVAKSTRAPGPKPASTSSAAALVSAGAAPVGEPTGNYQRLTVFLTPAQRTWLKNTGRQLPVDGLSVSDIVRLAVTRLSVDVNAGLPLVEELTAQAYSDAETMAGRRNRGLPPK